MVLEGHIRGSSYHHFLLINTVGSVSSPRESNGGPVWNWCNTICWGEEGIKDDGKRREEGRGHKDGTNHSSKLLAQSVELRSKRELQS